MTEVTLERVLPHVPVYPRALTAGELATEAGLPEDWDTAVAIDRLLRSVRPKLIAQHRPAEDTIWSKARA